LWSERTPNREQQWKSPQYQTIKTNSSLSYSQSTPKKSESLFIGIETELWIVCKWANIWKLPKQQKVNRKLQ
jgi:hypothetical protein